MRLDELLPSRRHGIKKRKQHHHRTNENEEGGCANGGLRWNEEEPELGRGFLPIPKQEPPRATLFRYERSELGNKKCPVGAQRVCERARELGVLMLGGIGSNRVEKGLQFCRKRYRSTQSVGRASRVPLIS